MVKVSRPIFRVADIIPFTIYAQDINGNPVSLAQGGAVIKWAFQILNQSGAVISSGLRDATILEPSNPLGAKVRYVTVPGDLSAAGFLSWEWKLIDLGGLSHGPAKKRFAEIVQPIA